MYNLDLLAGLLLQRYWVVISSLTFITDGLMQFLWLVHSFHCFYFLHIIHLAKLTNIQLIVSAILPFKYEFNLLSGIELHLINELLTMFSIYFNVEQETYSVDACIVFNASGGLISGQ